MQHIGEYKILGLLGEGGYGEVWEAESQSSGSKVAIQLVNILLSYKTLNRIRKKRPIIRK